VEIRKLIKELIIISVVLQMSYRWYKMTKYYHIHLQPNLFGGISVIRLWGGINSKKSGHKITMCDSEEQVSEVILATIKRRKARGYLPC
jgi:predicted DNA-binding WGR domain protein